MYGALTVFTFLIFVVGQQNYQTSLRPQREDIIEVCVNAYSCKNCFYGEMEYLLRANCVDKKQLYVTIYAARKIEARALKRYLDDMQIRVRVNTQETPKHLPIVYYIKRSGVIVGNYASARELVDYFTHHQD